MNIGCGHTCSARSFLGRCINAEVMRKEVPVIMHGAWSDGEQDLNKHKWRKITSQIAAEHPYLFLVLDIVVGVMHSTTLQLDQNSSSSNSDSTSLNQKGGTSAK